jgi:hypothetical protein
MPYDWPRLYVSDSIFPVMLGPCRMPLVFFFLPLVYRSPFSELSSSTTTTTTTINLLAHLFLFTFLWATIF